MLKWTSESEYFLSFEKKFADTIVYSGFQRTCKFKNRTRNSRMLEIQIRRGTEALALQIHG